MTPTDLEQTYNQILQRVRDRRRVLKEELDRHYWDDEPQTARTILDQMLTVLTDAEELEKARADFFALLESARLVQKCRDTMLESADALMDSLRKFLSLRDELTRGIHLGQVREHIRSEMHNPSFELNFDLVSEKELEWVTGLRALARLAAWSEPIPPPTWTATEHSPAREHGAGHVGAAHPLPAHAPTRPAPPPLPPPSPAASAPPPAPPPRAERAERPHPAEPPHRDESSRVKLKPPAEGDPAWGRSAPTDIDALERELARMSGEDAGGPEGSRPGGERRRGETDQEEDPTTGE